MPVSMAAVGRLSEVLMCLVLLPQCFCRKCSGTVSLKMNASDDNDLSRHAQII